MSRPDSPASERSSMAARKAVARPCCCHAINWIFYDLDIKWHHTTDKSLQVATREQHTSMQRNMAERCLTKAPIFGVLLLQILQLPLQEAALRDALGQPDAVTALSPVLAAVFLLTFLLFCPCKHKCHACALESLAADAELMAGGLPTCHKVKWLPEVETGKSFGCWPSRTTNIIGSEWIWNGMRLNGMKWNQRDVMWCYVIWYYIKAYEYDILCYICSLLLQVYAAVCWCLLPFVAPNDIGQPQRTQRATCLRRPKGVNTEGKHRAIAMLTVKMRWQLGITDKLALCRRQNRPWQTCTADMKSDMVCDKNCQLSRLASGDLAYSFRDPSRFKSSANLERSPRLSLIADLAAIIVVLKPWDDWTCPCVWMACPSKQTGRAGCNLKSQMPRKGTN